MSAKKALVWMVFWICLALCFNAGIYYVLGKEKALEFLGGYVLEKSLSLDNLFLFLTIFSSFGIRPRQQRRVLNFGIFFAVVLRLVFVLLGVTAIGMFHWILYIFGGILVLSGMKMVFRNEGNADFRDSRTANFMNRLIPIAHTMQGEKFFVRKNGTLHATPLLPILIIIELSDIVFAVDSIPAIFSITTDVFIVYTSNIFAILGLRSMYFVLGKLHERFRYVRYGVAMILTFTGLKLLAEKFGIVVSTEASLIAVCVTLLASILLSLAFSPYTGKHHNKTKKRKAIQQTSLRL